MDVKEAEEKLSKHHITIFVWVMGGACVVALGLGIKAPWLGISFIGFVAMLLGVNIACGSKESKDCEKVIREAEEKAARHQRLHGGPTGRES